MTVRFNLVGIVVADMAASLAFYRRLGLDIPAEADAEPHVELTLADWFTKFRHRLDYNGALRGRAMIPARRSR